MVKEGNPNIYMTLDLLTLRLQPSFCEKNMFNFSLITQIDIASMDLRTKCDNLRINKRASSVYIDFLLI